MSDHCPACGAFLPEPVLAVYSEDMEVYETVCINCGAETDYVPGLFVKEE